MHAYLQIATQRHASVYPSHERETRTGTEGGKGREGERERDRRGNNYAMHLIMCSCPAGPFLAHLYNLEVKGLISKDAFMMLLPQQVPLSVFSI